MSVNRRVTKRGAVYDVRLRTRRRHARTSAASARAERPRSSRPVSAPTAAAAPGSIHAGPKRRSPTSRSEWLASNPAKRPGSLARDEGIVRAAPRARARRASARHDHAGRRTDARQGRGASDTKPRTVRRQFGVVRAVFRFAVERDYIGRSPCRAIKLPRGPARDPAGRDGCRPRAPGRRARARITRRWRTSARCSACAGASAQGCASAASTSCGRRSSSRSRSRAGRAAGTSPGRRSRRPAGARSRCPTALAAMLTEHLARRGLTGADERCARLRERAGRAAALRALAPPRVAPCDPRAGLDGLTFHDLRRANATALVLDGVDLKTAQTRLGHSDPRLTLAVYAQATTEADRAAADALGRRFFDARAMNAR